MGYDNVENITTTSNTAFRFCDSTWIIVILTMEIWSKIAWWFNTSYGNLGQQMILLE